MFFVFSFEIVEIDHEAAEAEDIQDGYKKKGYGEEKGREGATKNMADPRDKRIANDNL